MDETVDIVDENDQVIGQELRSKCHINKILHRSVAIFLFKDKSYQEIVIQKRSKKMYIKPGKLCFPGGHLLAGENYLAGAKKELQEEMFHQHELPKEIKFEELFKVRKTADDDHEFLTVYLSVYPGPFSLDPAEVEKSYFIDINELVNDIREQPNNYTETTLVLIKEYMKRKKN